MKQGRAVGVSLLLICATVVGFVGVVPLQGQASIGIAIDDPSVPSGTNVTAIAYGIDDGTVTFQLDVENDGTIDQTWTVATDDSTAELTFDPSAYGQSQGTYRITANGTTSAAVGEVDDTPPSTAITATNPDAQQLRINVTVWDTLDNDWERLQRLDVEVTGPVNTTIPLAEFTETADTDRNETVYSTTLNVNADGRYTVRVSNATDRAGNSAPDSETPSTELIIDTNPPNLWNASAIDATNGNQVVDDGDRVVVTANVSDRFLDEVYVDASAFGAGNVSLTQVEGNYYRGHFTVDTAKADRDATYPLYVWATDAGSNSNRTFADTITLDTAAPTFTNSTPTAGAFSNTSSQNITVDIVDRSSVRGSIVVADATGTRLNGSFENTTGVTLQGGTLVVDTSRATSSGAFVDGPVTVNLSATDAEGHTASASWEFTVDTVKPAIRNTTITDEHDGDGIVSNGHNVTVAATVTDERLNRSQVLLDASAYGAGTVEMTAESTQQTRYTATFTVNTSTNVSAETPLPIRAADLAGNIQSASAGSLHLDTIAPAPPTGIRSTPITISNEYAYPLQITLPDAHQNVTVTLRLANRETTVTTSTDVSATTDSTQVSLDASSLPDGRITVAATVSDPAENVNPGGWVTIGTVLKDTARPRATSAHAVAGSRNISMPVSEPLPERDYTALDIEYTGPQSVEAVSLSQQNVLEIRLSGPITEQQLSNAAITSGLDEDVTDRVGNPAVDEDGVQLTPSHHFSGQVTYSDGEPAAGLTVTLSYHGKVLTTATTNWNGRYSLKVSDPDYSTDDERLTLSVKGVTTHYQWKAGTTTEANIVVPEPAPTDDDVESDFDPSTGTTTVETTTQTSTTTQTTTQTPTQTTTETVQTTPTQSTTTVTSTTVMSRYIQSGGWTTGIGLILFTILVAIAAILGWRRWKQPDDDEPPRL